MICEIIPEKRTGPDKDTFSYLVPEKLQNDVKIGSICEIPFGKKTIRGVIRRIQNTNNSKQMDYELKEIISIDQNLTIPESYIKIAKWISEYYLCSLGEAIALFLPPKILRGRKIQETRNKKQETNNSQLTTEQDEIFKQLKAKLKTKNFKPSLLLGVTGSGKTEVYIKLVEEILKLKKQAIVLTPEIILTPQLVERFEQIFPGQICLIHSGLSQGERYRNYLQFYKSEKAILIGPRSALLVPSENIGLIIVDEEQEDAYKQEKDPRYHAVELAERIAKENNVMLLVGTATPRIETYYRAVAGVSEAKQPEKKDCHGLRPRNDEHLMHDDAKYDLFELKSRYQKLILPTAEIVDLKNEIKRDNYSPISLALQREIALVLKNNRHVILFLNRRGVATFVSCRECGEVINCPRCEIPLVYHINFQNHILNCHHCDYKMPVPAICPKCKSPKIKFFGAGVDKIESEVERLFPNKRIKKIDSKVLQNKGLYLKLYEDLKNGKIDILIGTQILAKGLDIGTIDLVGIISADVGLHLPHFRASEKTFSLLTQVSGRSGRTDNVGKTLIQTYWPESSAIKFAADHAYTDFYENELLERKKFNYPPFCHLVRVVSEDKNEQKAKNNISDVALKLKKEKIDFIGPAKCFMGKINNKFRYHLIIKTKILPDQKIYNVYKENPYLVWDADPVDLL